MTKQMMVILAIIFYVVLSSFVLEPNSLGVARYQIEDSELNGITVVFASDFHLKSKEHKKLDKIVKLINKQNADIALIGGDILTGHDKKKTMDVFTAAQKLTLIKAPTFAVMGENDYWASGDDLASALNYNGVKVLKNSSARIAVKRKYISIVGIDDITTHSANIPVAFYGTRLPRIVISHNPDVYYNITERVNLILAGHTHGGQFLLPFSPPLFVPSKYGAKFASGLIEISANKMIVSKGIGMTFLPVRFNCRPEIVVVEFVGLGSSNAKRGF